MAFRFRNCFLYVFEIKHFPAKYTLTDVSNGQNSGREAIRMNHVALVRAD